MSASVESLRYRTCCIRPDCSVPRCGKWYISETEGTILPKDEVEGNRKSLIKFLKVCKSFYKGQNIQIELSKADVEGSKLYKQLQEIQDESLSVHFPHCVYYLRKAQYS